MQLILSPTSRRDENELYKIPAHTEGVDSYVENDILHTTSLAHHCNGRSNLFHFQSRHCEERSNPFHFPTRHCEERSNPKYLCHSEEGKISLDCFVPRNDGMGDVHFLPTGSSLRDESECLLGNGNEDNRHNVGSGIYFYKMVTDDYVSVKKKILMK